MTGELGGEARGCRVPCWAREFVPVWAVDAQQQVDQRQHHKDTSQPSEVNNHKHTINIRKQRGLALGELGRMNFSSIMQEQEMNYSQANSWFPDLSRPGQMHSSREFTERKLGIYLFIDHYALQNHSDTGQQQGKKKQRALPATTTIQASRLFVLLSKRTALNYCWTLQNLTWKTPHSAFSMVF